MIPVHVCSPDYFVIFPKRETGFRTVIFLYFVGAGIDFDMNEANGFLADPILGIPITMPTLRSKMERAILEGIPSLRARANSARWREAYPKFQRAAAAAAEVAR